VLRLTAHLLVVAAFAVGCGDDADPASRGARPEPGLAPVLSAGEMAKVAGGGTALGDGGAVPLSGET
jgi:hypothetical protein